MNAKGNPQWTGVRSPYHQTPACGEGHPATLQWPHSGDDDAYPTNSLRKCLATVTPIASVGFATSTSNTTAATPSMCQPRLTATGQHCLVAFAAEQCPEERDRVQRQHDARTGRGTRCVSDIPQRCHVHPGSYGTERGCPLSNTMPEMTWGHQQASVAAHREAWAGQPRVVAPRCYAQHLVC